MATSSDSLRERLASARAEKRESVATVMEARRALVEAEERSNELARLVIQLEREMREEVLASPTTPEERLSLGCLPESWDPKALEPLTDWFDGPSEESICSAHKFLNQLVKNGSTASSRRVIQAAGKRFEVAVDLPSIVVSIGESRVDGIRVSAEGGPTLARPTGPAEAKVLLELPEDDLPADVTAFLFIRDMAYFLPRHETAPVVTLTPGDNPSVEWFLPYEEMAQTRCPVVLVVLQSRNGFGWVWGTWEIC